MHCDCLLFCAIELLLLTYLLTYLLTLGLGLGCRPWDWKPGMVTLNRTLIQLWNCHVAEIQTTSHFVDSCPLTKLDCGLSRLFSAHDDAVQRLAKPWKVNPHTRESELISSWIQYIYVLFCWIWIKLASSRLTPFVLRPSVPYWVCWWQFIGAFCLRVFSTALHRWSGRVVKVTRRSLKCCCWPALWRTKPAWYHICRFV